MPIGPFEAKILRVLAANRNPESFIGGATVLNQRKDSPRTSEDIDVFHDSEASLLKSVELELVSGLFCSFNQLHVRLKQSVDNSRKVRASVGCDFLHKAQHIRVKIDGQIHLYIRPEKFATHSL